MAPPIRNRLLWWFGIYFVAQVPLIENIQGFYLFPWGLLGVLVSGPSAKRPDLMVLAFIGYGFYAVHFLVTMMLPSRTAFIVLMIILTLAVTFNLAGCEVLNGQLRHIN